MTPLHRVTHHSVAYLPEAITFPDHHQGSWYYTGNALEQSAVESHGAEDDDRLANLFKVRNMSMQRFRDLHTHNLAGPRHIYRPVHDTRSGETDDLAFVEVQQQPCNRRSRFYRARHYHIQRLTADLRQTKVSIAAYDLRVAKDIITTQNTS